MPKDIPKYCPYCGSEEAKYGHDDNCGRPTNSQRIHIYWAGENPNMRIS